jgi:hypothetical protein
MDHGPKDINISFTLASSPIQVLTIARWKARTVLRPELGNDGIRQFRNMPNTRESLLICRKVVGLEHNCSGDNMP